MADEGTGGFFISVGRLYCFEAATERRLGIAMGWELDMQEETAATVGRSTTGAVPFQVDC